MQRGFSMSRLILLATALFMNSALPALAQEDLPAPQKFGDGEITFERGEDDEISVLFKGKEIYRNYYVSFDRMVNIGNEDVALLFGGDGGNACGPASLILTLPTDSPDGKLEIVGEDCGAPEPAVTSNEIYYVPYLKPGAVETLQSWSPSTGLIDAGKLSFEPKPDTTWATLDPKAIDGPWALFDNAEIYKDAGALVGGRFEEFITGLSVAGPPELVDGNFLWASGCTPHACGAQDGFVGIDIKARKIYAAIRGSEAGETLWPADLKSWPPQLQKAFADSKVE
jgi:hypothetical protein